MKLLSSTQMCLLTAALYNESFLSSNVLVHSRHRLHSLSLKYLSRCFPKIVSDNHNTGAKLGTFNADDVSTTHTSRPYVVLCHVGPFAGPESAGISYCVELL